MWRRSGQRPSNAGCGCDRSATLSTRCRRMSAPQRTSQRSPPPWSAPSPRFMAAGLVGVWSMELPGSCPVPVPSDPPAQGCGRLAPVSWFLDDLAAKAAERERAGLTRRLVARHGDALLDLASNDYLGLTHNAGVI